jgi:hypothetical protein
VSKSNVKALRYSLLLPLIHLAISVPVIYYEEASIWRYIPRIQAEEDFEKNAPPPVIHSGPQIEWRPCYEYRPSIADEVIALVEFPAGMLIAPHGSSENVCNPAILRPLLLKLRNWMRVKTRIVVLDCLLLLGIVGQWWLVGFWLDYLREWRRSSKRWIIPVAAITISGISGAGVAFGEWAPLRIGAAILSFIAFLAWVILLLMFAVTAARWAIQFSRKGRATEIN